VLRAATPDIAVGILELRLRHFMQHQRYQHALILDKVGDYYFVEKEKTTGRISILRILISRAVDLNEAYNKIICKSKPPRAMTQ